MAQAAEAAAAPPRTAVERGIRVCANRARRAHGLAPLAFSKPLTQAARLHAHNMARLGFFDHTDPQGRGVGERVAIFDRAGRFTYLGENIAAGQGSAASACDSWMGSAGHRANILNPEFTHIGGGFAAGRPYRRYYVQVFGRPSR
ncbi:MAG: CAP domain-containing protein [Solirubrobacterales bacterium]